jgi:hypothetical protein
MSVEGTNEKNNTRRRGRECKIIVGAITENNWSKYCWVMSICK